MYTPHEPENIPSEDQPHPVIPIASLNRNFENDLPFADTADDFEHHHPPVILVAEGGPAPKTSKQDDTHEKVGAILTTILVHTGLALLLLVLVIQIEKPKPPNFVATLAENRPDTPPTRTRLARTVKSNPTPPASKSLAVFTVNISAPISAPSLEFADDSDSLNLGNSNNFGTLSGVNGVGPGQGIGISPEIRSRCSAAERAKMRHLHGGVQLGDQKIHAALKYLASVQNEDGSWGTEYHGAMTGLALLSYLGYCITPDHSEYGETVMKGILYLVEFHRNEQELYATSTNHGQSYEHGIATYALGEVYAIARLGKRKLPGMKEAFEQGVQTIIDGQNPDGGWSYGYPARGASDTSVTGWQYQALKAAQHTKLRFSGLSGSIRKAQQYLDDIQDRNNGMFPYRPGQPGKPSLTGAGVLGLQMLGGAGYRDEIEKGLGSILDGIKGKSWGNANLYEWYYNTQATFEAGGDTWKQWNDLFQNHIVENQQPDGSWSSSSASQGGKNIYATCLCTLMLEVYYRYLPAASGA